MEAKTITVADGMPPDNSSGDDREELTAALQRIRRLIETSAVEEARALAAEMGKRWPDDRDAQHWARVLTPPQGRVVKGPRFRSLDRERAWLRKHAHEYRGCWLAVFGDKLIIADPSLAAVLDTVRQTPGAETALIHFQGRGSE